MFCMNDVWDSNLESTHDLNVTLEWFTCAMDTCLCIVCTGVILLRKEKRVMHWMEAMRLQGMPLKFMLGMHDDISIDQERGMTFAGNAFSGFVVSPMVTGTFTHVPWKELKDALDEWSLNDSEDEDNGSDEGNKNENVIEAAFVEEEDSTDESSEEEGSSAETESTGGNVPSDKETNGGTGGGEEKTTGKNDDCDSWDLDSDEMD